MRLIDADALKDHFCEACSTKKRYKRTVAECRTYSNALYGYSCFKMRLIDTAPTIDAEPVQHGRWIVAIVNNTPHFKCSECNKYIEAEWTANFDYVFCPNCGAKMDEEVQDD